MQRRIAAAAFVLGAVGVAPILLGLAGVLLGLDLHGFVARPMRVVEGAIGLLGSLIFAPCLLLWGLIEVQRTERGRWRVRSWALLLCVGGAPFGVGIILCLPVFLYVILPIMRQFRLAGDITRAAPSA